MDVFVLLFLMTPIYTPDKYVDSVYGKKLSLISIGNRCEKDYELEIIDRLLWCIPRG